MIDWKLIDDKAKDGRAVLIYSEPDMAVACWYRGDVEQGELNEIEPFWAVWDGHDYMLAFRRHLATPTHWAELPDKPVR